MPKYVIERELPGAGKLSAAELKAISQKSNGILRDLGPDIQWVQSYVVRDRTFCVYLARDEALIRQHAELSGFPANRIHEVSTLFDPSTATGRVVGSVRARKEAS